jgi:SAM-dependent methyltransferase
MVQTAERISHIEESDNVIFQRSVFAYHEAAKLVKGKLLEIGTGMGYGIEHLMPVVDQYFAVDKYNSAAIEENKDNPKFQFHQMTVPPLKGIDDESMDFIVTFQVIEHIKKDHLFVEEAHRVLKKGGKLILTTPNNKMSLTRNPWHIREYTVEQLKGLLLKNFSEVDALGVFGNEKTMEYYEENKKSVKKYTRFDIFNLQYILPRQLLQIPYDVLNRMNRKKLLEENTDKVRDISATDYHLAPANDTCFDLFYVATK